MLYNFLTKLFIGIAVWLGGYSFIYLVDFQYHLPSNLKLGVVFVFTFVMTLITLTFVSAHLKSKSLK